MIYCFSLILEVTLVTPAVLSAAPMAWLTLRLPHKKKRDFFAPILYDAGDEPSTPH